MKRKMTAIMKDDEGFLEMLRTRMSTEEQQVFVSHFKTYLRYGHDDSFVMDLESVWEWLGFTFYHNARRCVHKHFMEGEDFIEKALIPTDNRNGGQNKLSIMMTINTFKELCMFAKTDKAKTVRKYYIKMERLMHDYMTNAFKRTQMQLEENQMKMEENQMKMDIMTEELQSAKEDAEWARHRGLIGGHRNRRLVYSMFVMPLDGEAFVIKIGSTADLQVRVSQIAHDFKLRFRVMDVWECDAHTAFEKAIHNFRFLLERKYTKKIGAKVSTEAFIMDNMRTYNSLKLQIQQHVHKYKAYTLEKKHVDDRRLDKEMEKMKLESFKVLVDAVMAGRITEETYCQSLQTLNRDGAQRPEEAPAEAPLLPPPVSIDRSKHNIGPRVQLYDPADLSKVVKVIDGLVDATIEVPNASYSQIKAAARDHTTYMGYRWFLIDRSDPDPSAPRELPPTSVRQRYVKGAVAKMNEDGTEVLEVFALQKLAAEAVRVTSGALSTAVKRGSRAGGFRWKLWQTVPPELQERFLADHALPPTLPHPRATFVQQLDPTTHEVVREYASLTDVQKATRITSKVIKEANASGKIVEGYMWRLVT